MGAQAKSSGRQVSFDVTPAEAAIVQRIVERAAERFARSGVILPAGDKMSLAMDIEATHCNGCPLRLEDLLAADDFNFAHDVVGIMRHIDRQTGQLTNHFSPRFAAPAEQL